jgi:hypothetical protein
MANATSPRTPPARAHLPTANCQPPTHRIRADLLSRSTGDKPATVVARMDLQREIDSAPDGGTVEIPKGTWEAVLVIRKSITLRGEGPGKSILDGQGRGACVLVDAPNAKVNLVGLTLKHGTSPEGGCISYRSGESLHVEDCVLVEGAAKAYGGGGARLAGRKASFLRVRILECSGQQGGGILADGLCETELIGCVLSGNQASQGGALRVKEGAKVRLVHCTFAGNKAVGKNALGDEIVITGTMTRTPELAVINSILAPGAPAAIPLGTFGPYNGKVSLAHTLLPGSAKDRVPPGPGLVFASPEFMPQGQHRQAISAGSPAIGAGDPAATPSELTDFLGNPLLKAGKSDLGAYAG